MIVSHRHSLSLPILLSVLLFVFMISNIDAADVKPKKSKYFLSKPQCNQKLMNQTDLDVVKLMCFGENGRKFPEGLKDLKPFCKQTTVLVNRIEAFFRDCYRKDISDLANILVFSIKSQIRVFCGRKSRRLTQMLKSSKCVNDKFIKNSSCLDLFNTLTKKVTLLDDDSIKIKHTCCSYVTAMDCVDRIVNSDPCTAQYSELYHDFIRAIFGSFTTVMCGEYNESTTKCEELGPIPKIKKSASKAVIRDDFNSFVFVLLDLLESMNNFELPDQ